MQNLLKKLTLVAGLIATATPSYATPQQPKTTVTTKETKASVQWSTVPGASSYTLFYAPHPALIPIKSIPMEGETDFAAELPLGASYAVAIKASDSSGDSHYSNIEVVRIENPDRVKIKRTGQKKSYHQLGHEVTDRSIKDDGYYQTGITQSYTRDDAKEVVTDHVTGLMWQDDIEAKTIRKPWVAQTTDFNDTSGDTQTTYCANLTLGDFDDWRMPTRAEMVGLNNYGRIDPASNPEFKNVGFDYCSSTPVAGVNTNWSYFETLIWCNMAYPGSQAPYEKANHVNVRCVREEKEKPTPIVANFNRNNGVVTDINTGLQWQDDYNDNNNKIKVLDWLDAIEYCESLPLDGGKWRLPNMNEITSLVDETTYYPSINSTFQNTAAGYGYWTSSTSGDSIGRQTFYGRTINFEDGHQNNDDKSSELAVRCVR